MRKLLGSNVESGLGLDFSIPPPPLARKGLETDITVSIHSGPTLIFLFQEKKYPSPIQEIFHLLSKLVLLKIA